MVAFVLQGDQVTEVRIQATDPDPPALIRLGPAGEASLPGVVFTDELAIVGTGDRRLKVASLGGPPMEAARRPRTVAEVSDLRRPVAATSTDSGPVVVFAESDGADDSKLRAIRLDGGGTVLDEAVVPTTELLTTVDVVDSPRGILVGAVGEGTLYIARVSSEHPTSFLRFQALTLPEEQAPQSVAVLSFLDGDAALFTDANSRQAVMAILDAADTVGTLVAPVVGPGDAVVGAAGSGAVVAWIRNTGEAPELMRAAVECR